MSSAPSDDLRRLLARMRAERGQAEFRSGGVGPGPAPLPADAIDPAAAATLRFRLTVDDGGEFLVLLGAQPSVGHTHGGRADLPLLADLEAVHARFLLRGDFHTGPSWSVLPQRPAEVRVDGRAVVGEPARLDDGDELELGSNVRLVFHLPERSSGSALLELKHGLESEGTMHVLLLAPGLAGRVRIGPHAARHVPVAGLEHEVELSADARGLKIGCSGGVRGFGPSGELAPATEQCLPFPLSGRYDLSVNARPSGRVPFGLGLWPLPEIHAGGPGGRT